MPATEPNPKTAIRASARETRARAFERFGERIGPILTANFLAQFSYPPRIDIAGYWPTADEAGPPIDGSFVSATTRPISSRYGWGLV